LLRCAACSFFAIAISPDGDDGMAKTAAVGEVREWAKGQGFDLLGRGRLPIEVWAAWERRSTTPTHESRSVTPTVSVEQSAAAQERIDRLERQVVELAARLVAVESRPADARRRFPRSR
jgi:phosphate uptake regulator